MFDKKANKMIKDWYPYLMDTIASSEFWSYYEAKQKKATESNLTRIENDPLLASRTDFFADAYISRVQICDLVDNNGFSNLIDKIHKLPKEYERQCCFRKPTRTHKCDYVHLTYEGRGYGVVADIKFPNSSKFIDHINISYSQLNNYFYFIEYEFGFKKRMEDEEIKDFILENLPNLTNKDYKNPFRIGDSSILNYNAVIQALETLFTEICQHFITTMLYSEKGKYLKLPSLTSHIRHTRLDISTFASSQDDIKYYNKEQNFVIVENPENNDFNLYSGEKLLPDLSICELVWKYGNDFYFMFFKSWFLNYFQLTYSKYIDRKKIPDKNLSALLKFYYGLNDTVLYTSYGNLILDFNSKWEMYQGYDPIKFEVGTEQILSQFKDIFKNAYEHCKAQLDIKTNRVSRIISYIALTISLVSVVLGIVSIIVNKIC